jgi:hypothetical protein
MKFGVTEFQRYFLEVRGALDYLEEYKPRMDGIQPRRSAVANCIGAFTIHPRVVQDFFDAGLPVYFVCRLHELPTNPPPNILSVVNPLLHREIVDDDAEPPFPIIYSGSPNKNEKHAAMHRYSRTWMVYKDPFGERQSTSESSGQGLAGDPFTSGRGLATASIAIPMGELMQPRTLTSDSQQQPCLNKSTVPCAPAAGISRSHASNVSRLNMSSKSHWFTSIDQLLKVFCSI